MMKKHKKSTLKEERPNKKQKTSVPHEMEMQIPSWFNENLDLAENDHLIEEIVKSSKNPQEKIQFEPGDTKRQGQFLFQFADSAFTISDNLEKFIFLMKQRCKHCTRYTNCALRGVGKNKTKNCTGFLLQICEEFIKDVDRLRKDLSFMKVIEKKDPADTSKSNFRWSDKFQFQKKEKEKEVEQPRKIEEDELESEEESRSSSSSSSSTSRTNSDSE